MPQDETTTSLGRDFLTHLCYCSDALGGQFRSDATGEQFVILLDGKIVLEDDRDLPPSTLTYAGDDFTGQQFRQALRDGKKVREARLRIEKGENTWTFTLRADRLEIAGLKIDMPGAQTEEERLYGRMLCLEALCGVLDACFQDFIAEVQSDTWKKQGYATFQKWLNAP